MNTNLESFTIFSKSAKKLAKFYRESVGLKVTFEAVMGKSDEIFEFKMKNGTFYIFDNSKLKGNNKNPERFVFSLETNDIESEVKRLRKNKVKVIKDINHIGGYGFVVVLADVDGNYFQLVQTKGGKTPKAFKK